MVKFLVVFLFTAPTFAESVWKHESEIGIALSNSDTADSISRKSETWSLKQTTSWEREFHILRMRANFLRTRTLEITETEKIANESARLWSIGFRHEWLLANHFNLFVEYSLEADITKPYLQKNNADIGVKYFFAQSKPTTWFAEFGYRNIRLDYAGTTETQVVGAIRAYTEFNQALTETSRGLLKIEYVPNITKPPLETGPARRAGYTLTFEPSVEMKLNANLVFKLTYHYKEDETPNQFLERTPSITRTLTTSLAASF